MTEILDTIVIGAGLSGLQAARVLSEAGLKVLVLEARNRVGGRTLSCTTESMWPLGIDSDPPTVAPSTFDLGGQWIGPNQDRVISLSKHLGIRTFRQYTTGARVLDLYGQVSRYRGAIPKLPLFDMLQAGLGVVRLELESRLVDPRHPWRAPFAKHFDRQSLEAWARSAIPSRKARELLRFSAEMLLTVPMNEISYLQFLHYLRSGSSLLTLTESEGGAQQDRFVDGAQALSLGLARPLGDRVALSSPVREICCHADRVEVVCDDRVLAARRVILALAPAMARTIRFTPGLPSAREALHHEMPMGSIVKAILFYDRPYWREAGLSGEAVSDSGPCRGFFDDTAHDGRHPALVGFVVAAEARVERTEAERRSAIEAQAIRLGLVPRNTRATAYIEKNWNEDPWSGGCYVGVMPPGLMTRVGEALRAPVGRLHFAGTETATRWAGYFDGALEAGDRAAHEVLTAR